MVDSAPELRLTVPSWLIPSKVRPVAGSYIRTPAGLAPRYQLPTMPARSVAAVRVAGRATAVASRDCSRESAP